MNADQSDQRDSAWPVGEITGRPIASHAAALLEGGPSYLTQAFHAAGTLPADNAVSSITDAREWAVGGTGSKLILSVAYAKPTTLPTDLFVKFSRNPHDAGRDSLRFHMGPEIRFAAISNQPGFPIAVPLCLFADFDSESGTGILITDRIGYGEGDVEPHHHKCMDYDLDAPLDHYRALVRALARLAGAHKAGTLPDAAYAYFPFDPERAIAGDPMPQPRAKLVRKLEKLEEFTRSFPQLFPRPLIAPAFLQRVAREALRMAEQERAIREFLHADPDMIALCHWNGNIDNAWFWPDADGTLQCGLMDWGSVGQMHLAMTLLGSLSGMEHHLWAAHIEELVALFTAEYRAAGGPDVSPGRLMLHLRVYTALMGLAYLLDAPARIAAEFDDLTMIEGRRDPRFAEKENPRIMLHILTSLLTMWHGTDFDEILDRLPIADA
jgi:hypothetical protein